MWNVKCNSHSEESDNITEEFCLWSASIENSYLFAMLFYFSILDFYGGGCCCGGFGFFFLDSRWQITYCLTVTLHIFVCLFCQGHVLSDMENPKQGTLSPDKQNGSLHFLSILGCLTHQHVKKVHGFRILISSSGLS